MSKAQYPSLNVLLLRRSSCFRKQAPTGLAQVLSETREKAYHVRVGPCPELALFSSFLSGNTYWSLLFWAPIFCYLKLNRNFSGSRKMKVHIGLASFSAEKLFSGYLVRSSRIARPAGDPLGDIVALSNPKFSAQALVYHLGHILRKPQLKFAQSGVSIYPK